MPFDIKIIFEYIPASILVVIGYLQWLTSKKVSNISENLYRHGLSDRYLANYNKLVKANSIVIETGYVNAEAASLFCDAHAEAELLLGDEIVYYTGVKSVEALKAYKSYRELSANNSSESYSADRRRNANDEINKFLDKCLDEKELEDRLNIYKKYIPR